MLCGIERETAVRNLLRCVCEGGVESAHKAAVILERYLPYAEESQQMVNTVCIKVISHLAESGHEPGVSVTSHIIPVVCRHSPFLAINGECIGWGSGLTVCVEQIGMYPDIGAVAVYADGYVTFQEYALAVGIFLYISQLLVKVELDEIVLAYLAVTIVARSAEPVQQGVAVFGLFPCVEIGCAVFVTQIAVECVRLQPRTVCVEEFLELPALEALLAELGVETV